MWVRAALNEPKQAQGGDRDAVQTRDVTGAVRVGNNPGGDPST
jgi:hypothetical protein